MATIQASIQLKDGMSPALRAIDKAIGTVTAKLDRLQGSLDTALNPASVSKASTQIAQTANQLNRVEQEAQQAATAQEQLNANTSETASLAQRLDAGFQKVVSAIGLVSKQLGGMSMDMQEMVTHTSKISTNTQKIQTGQQQLTNTVRQGNKAMQQTATSIQRASVNQIRLTASFRQGVMQALRLKQPIATLDGEINQNTAAQQRFNNTLRGGASGATALLGKLKTIAGAYLGIQSVKAVINTADELTNTNARLSLMNDGLQTTAQLEDKIYQMAMRSRGGFLETADAVAKLGQRAGNIFKSNDETIAFTETLNKMFVIAGASQQEMSSATLQLTQALGSGVLRGEEFNAVFEAAPNVMQAVADYINQPIGKLKELASDGKISAEVVKNALFAATDKVNEQFKSMPYTWAQVWTTIKNYTIKATRPILQAISNITKNERFIAFANEVGNIISRIAGFIKNLFTVLAPVFTWIFDAIAGIYNFIVNNWSFLAPIIAGVAAAFIALKTPLAVVWLWTQLCTIATKAWTIAQAVFNAVMAMNPVMWVVLAVVVLIVVIYLVVAAINKVRDTSISATGVICGSVLWLGAAILNILAWVVNTIIGGIFALAVIIANIVIGIMNVIAGVVQAIVSAWNWCYDNIGAIFDNIGIWWTNLWADCYISFCDFITKVISKLSSLAEYVQPFAELLGMDIQGSLGKIQTKVDDAKAGFESKKKEYKSLTPFNSDVNWTSVDYLSVGDAWKTGYNSLGYFDLGNAYDTGYNWGDDKATQVENFFSGKNFKELSGDDLHKLWEQYGKNNVDKYGNVTGDGDKLNDIGKALSGNLGDNPALKDIAAGVGDLNDTTGKISDNLDASSDDLSFMRDLAERRAINRYYYTDMNVTQNNNNHIRNGVDADGVIEKLRRGIFETLSGGAEGAHI